MTNDFDVLSEEALHAALARDEQQAPARREAQQQRLAVAYGAVWLDRVRDLPSAFAAVALPAASARLDGVGEDDWIGARGNADSWLTHTKTDRAQPHADAPNRYEQAIRVLRDEGLWPWSVVIGPGARVSPDTII